MISNIIRRKLGYYNQEFTNRISFVKHMEGHKNSKGETAPWVIVDHKDGKVLSSHKSKEEAQRHLKDMHVFASYLPVGKEEEIVVWMRLQEDMDKQQIIQFVEDKFNLNSFHSDKLYTKAFPDKLEKQEESVLNNLDEEFNSNKINIPKELIDDIFSMHLENASINSLQKYETELGEEVPSILNNICYILLKNRNLI